MNNSSVSELKGAIIRIAKRLYQKNINVTLSGNISARLDSKRIMITPSGVDKSDLTPEQLSIVEIESGKLLEGPRQSSEYRVHTYIYKAMPKINAIVHPHPEFSLAFVEAKGLKALDLEGDEEASYYIGKLGMAEGKTGTTDLAEAVRTQIVRGATVVMVKGHGTVGIGKTLHEALGRVEALEHVARKRTIFYSLK